MDKIKEVFTNKNMRGLRNFITEVLDCRSKEEEKLRVNKELANIRKNFAGASINGYNKKKYVAKLLYIHLLGYTFDFGFNQMIELLTSNVFSEKQIGYITLGVYLNGNYDLVTMLIQHIGKEMKNVENEPAQCLALACAANIGGTEIAETLAPSILQVLNDPKSSEFVKKKAALALVRIYRETPSVFVYTEDVGRMLVGLLQDPNFGVQLSGASLVLVLMYRNSADLDVVYPIAIAQLIKIFFEYTIPLDYNYGRNAVPWLVLKYMRILQYKNKWTEEEVSKISRVIDFCLQKTDLLLNIKEVHANMMLLFESINLVIATQLSNQFLARAAAILGGFLSAKQSNVRYLSLETLTRLVSASPDVIPSLDKHRQTLYLALRDPDNSIRRRALSLLYVLCTPESAEEIVSELLNYLKFADITMREPLCLKIAVLAESFAPDLAWFVDIVIQLITLAGDECHDGVWHRVVQVISMNPQFQRYATLTCFNSMCSSTAHDRLIKLAAQLCGDYAQLIQTPPNEIIDEFKKKFPSCSEAAQATILSAFAKIGARYEPIRPVVLEFLRAQCGNQNIDIQQRAIEYTAMLGAATNVLSAVFKPIPPFRPRKSKLLNIINNDEITNNKIRNEEEDEEEQEEGLATVIPMAKPQGPPADQQYAQPMQQQAPPPAQEVDNLLGDFAPTTAPAPARPQSNQDDLASLMTPGPAQDEDLISAMGNASVGPPLSSQEVVFKRFLTSDQGVAYEDPVAQLNLAINQNGPMVILNFNIVNKSAAPLNNIKLHITPMPFFKVQTKNGPPTVPPNGVVTYQFAVTCTGPYLDPPDYMFGYSGAQDVRETMKLPLVITKFMTPFPMDNNTYFSRWAQFAAPNQIAKISYPPSQSADVNQQMASLMVMLLHIPVLPFQGLPAGNVVGAGVVQCESGPQGLLARFFANAQTRMIDVEVRCTSPSITSSIQKILSIHFK